MLGCVVLLYLGGVVGQMMTNYHLWLEGDGMTGGMAMTAPDWNPLVCFAFAFRPAGLKGILFILGLGGAGFLYIKFGDKFNSQNQDPRGFAKSSTGSYGTASWMDDKELRQVLEVSTVEKTESMILGEQKGKLICLPQDTRLNRHVAIFGASGTMKSRAVIRNALFQLIRRPTRNGETGESVLITDPKGELYADTAELFRKNGYEVRVFNLVNPEHSDSWNCMDGLVDNTLMAQVLTNVIIGNTTEGKGDHFWDNGESNLLKALVLQVALDAKRLPHEKNLPEVYRMLTNNSESDLEQIFKKLDADHPARAPYRLFQQASETVRAGVILGLGTRLQVLQNKSVCDILSRSDIDLTAPGKRKCAYFVILSDQESSMKFLSSLFFSFLFIKLVRYADSTPEQRCEVPVNLVLDEFNNIGRIGGAADGSDFARSLSVIRSRDIRVMLAVQSLGQLQNRYPNNLWAEIIGNCDIQLMLGCTDDMTAEHFSARSGDMSIHVDTTMTVRQTMAVAQMIPQYRQSRGEAKRRLLTADEILRLPNEEMLAIIRGHNILKLNKFDFTRHPMSKDLVRSSVMDYKPMREEKSKPQFTKEPEEIMDAPTVPKRRPPETNLCGPGQPPADF